MHFCRTKTKRQLLLVLRSIVPCSMPPNYDYVNDNNPTNSFLEKTLTTTVPQRVGLMERFRRHVAQRAAHAVGGDMRPRVRQIVRQPEIS